MKKWIGATIILAVTGILIGIIVIPAIAQGGGGAAQIPNTISYQGYLTDSNGISIEDPVEIVFSIYEVDTGSTPVWTETHNSVDPEDGLFSVTLGSGSPIYANHLSEQRYLGITVEDDSEMTPRQLISSVAFSLRADKANSAFTLVASDGDPQDAVYVSHEGYVGIGTTNPEAMLQIKNSQDGMIDPLLITDDNDNMVAIIGVGSSGNPHLELFNVLGDSRIKLSSDSDSYFNMPGFRLGIGTDAPDVELDVNGSISANGCISANGTLSLDGNTTAINDLELNLLSGESESLANDSDLVDLEASSVSTSVAGNGLGGGGGAGLDVNVDDSTIQITGDILQIKDSGVTNDKLANSTLTITAGNGLTGGGTVSLGNSVTVNAAVGDGLEVDANEISLADSIEVDYLTVTDYAVVGSTGTGIDGVFSNDTMLDFPSLNQYGYADLTMSVVGATVGDPVFLGVPDGSVEPYITYFAWVSSPSIVTVRIVNNGPIVRDVDSGTFRVTVFSF